MKYIKKFTVIVIETNWEKSPTLKYTYNKG